ncbi:NACHT domain-containing protein [Scytonema sp. UIC 10036]|uniref:NACHT domain-containing protein n=1 Tax=Scytonema sp. UIC 10036 TaxID=2304196 RepID=UPI0012DA7996|nr:NACHT domain-containing protein [Scytonema sp. UIC 10036]MUH01238.1 NACHT domain-containing protein [Scytonema sp. UIC 10036]
MAAISVNQKIFEKLQQAYIEKFGASPKFLITELNRVYQDKREDSKDIISDKTIRNFFKDNEPTKMQEKNLNFLCAILLGYESYQEALRQQTVLEQGEKAETDNQETWLHRYQEYLKRKCGTIKVLTMTQPLQLDSVYTQVNVLENIQGKQSKTLQELFSQFSNEGISFSRFNYRIRNHLSALDAVNTYSKLLIWGKPGAGKTTFLKHLVLYSIEQKEEVKEIPIFISLKAFSDKEDKQNLLDAVKEDLSDYIAETSQFVQDILEQGHCLILLDGLDEVGETKSDRIYQSIDNFVKKFPKNRFVLTCRSGSADYIFPDFTEVEIADFDNSQVEIFIRKWFAPSEDLKLADSLLEKIEKNRAIEELTANPLLLTMLCLVFDDRYELPSNQYSLIHDAVEILLRRWDASRRIERSITNKFNLPYQQKVNLLSKVAYESFLQEPHKILWQQRELEEIIGNYIENLPDFSTDTLNFDSLAILKRIEANHGLLVKQAQDIYSFSHLTFQEYFVANYIVESRSYEILKEVVKQHLVNRQWREVFLIIAGRLANADDFLKILFIQINKLVNSKRLQDMLAWLDDVTTYHGVKSSSWRAFYLFVDQEFELYTNQLSKVDSALAQKLATLLKEFNRERKKIIERSPLSDFALYLVDTYTKVSAKAENKQFKPHKVNPLLRKELPVSDDTAMAPQLGGEGVTIDKNRGVITLSKQQRQITLDKDNFPNQIISSITSDRSVNYESLADELIFLQESFPDDNAPQSDWQDWIKHLRGVMRLYLNIGYDDVKFSPEQIKTLKDYLYANILLLECIKGCNYSSKDLRTQILDYLLLPSKRIPETLIREQGLGVRG